MNRWTRAGRSQIADMRRDNPGMTIPQAVAAIREDRHRPALSEDQFKALMKTITDRNDLELASLHPWSHRALSGDWCHSDQRTPHSDIMERCAQCGQHLPVMPQRWRVPSIFGETT